MTSRDFTHTGGFAKILQEGDFAKPPWKFHGASRGSVGALVRFHRYAGDFANLLCPLQMKILLF